MNRFRIDPAKFNMILAACVLIATVIGGLLMFSEWSALQPAIHSVKWTQVKGFVTHSALTTFKSRNPKSGTISTTFGVDIRYKYQVGNREYQSNNVSFAGWANRSVIQDWHYERLLSKFPCNRPATVYVNPLNPEQSVLQPGVVAESFQSCGLLVVVLALGLGFELCLLHTASRGSRVSAGVLLFTLVLTVLFIVWGLWTLPEQVIHLVIPKYAQVWE